ncbi:MAG TPA: TIGR02996 domain-containing protein [Gemmataceae bacterium]|nr:TIGR02996 domain-containing protein [Gemmataceae bacterium]
MTHDEVFIHSIREAFHDDVPRLIYADWLEEHGQADRAEFIRIQCCLARPLAPDERGLTARAEELLRDHWKEWVMPLCELVGPKRDRYGEDWLREEFHPDALAHFHRGFVDKLALDAERFVSPAGALLALLPLRVLKLWGAGHCARELAECPRLAGLQTLAFSDYWDAPLTPHDAPALAASPYLSGLTALHLGWNSLADEGVKALTRAPWLASLVTLDLTDNGISDAGAHALADCPAFVRLRTLYLRRNPISSAGRTALTTSPHLYQLERLDLDVEA